MLAAGESGESYDLVPQLGVADKLESSEINRRIAASKSCNKSSHVIVLDRHVTHHGRPSAATSHDHGVSSETAKQVHKTST